MDDSMIAIIAIAVIPPRLVLIAEVWSRDRAREAKQDLARPCEPTGRFRDPFGLGHSLLLQGSTDSATRPEAARRAGVGASTFYVWLRLGRRGHPTFAALAKAVKSVEDARGLNVAFGRRTERRCFWNRLP
jgi:hypothetical protein